MPKDIFDLTDTSDLPEQLLGHKCGRPRQKGNTIWEKLLAQAGRPLHWQELAAARYRRDGVIIRRENLTATMRKLLGENRIIRTAPATYALPEHANVTAIKKQA